MLLAGALLLLAAQAVRSRVEQRIAEARRFRDANAIEASTSVDPVLVARVADACRALGDAACESRFRARSAELEERESAGPTARNPAIRAVR